jgi:hypothetical protein
MARLAIDAEFVRVWAARYLEALAEKDLAEELRLFREIGPRVRQRGSFTRAEFLEVAEWKSHRTRALLRRNRTSTIQGVTARALGNTDERLSILTALAGVSDPVASTLLAVWDPDRYTVYDWRAVGTLRLAGELPAAGKYPPVGLYIDVCRQLVERLRLGPDLAPHLRSLDRALWKFSQQRSRSRR